MPAQDLANGGNNITSPAGRYAVATPSDSADLSFVSRAIYVGGDGNIAAVSPEGQVVTFVGVPAGTILPIRCNRINLTGTTATNLVALW